jgi:hypothetical protein
LSYIGVIAVLLKCGVSIQERCPRTVFERGARWLRFVHAHELKVVLVRGIAFFAFATRPSLVSIDLQELGRGPESLG